MVIERCTAVFILISSPSILTLIRRSRSVGVARLHTSKIAWLYNEQNPFFPKFETPLLTVGYFFAYWRLNFHSISNNHDLRLLSATQIVIRWPKRDEIEHSVDRGRSSGCPAAAWTWYCHLIQPAYHANANTPSSKAIYKSIISGQTEECPVSCFPWELNEGRREGRCRVPRHKLSLLIGTQAS